MTTVNYENLAKTISSACHKSRNGLVLQVVCNSGTFSGNMLFDRKFGVYDGVVSVKMKVHFYLSAKFSEILSQGKKNFCALFSDETKGRIVHHALYTADFLDLDTICILKNAKIAVSKNDRKMVDFHIYKSEMINYFLNGNPASCEENIWITDYFFVPDRPLVGKTSSLLFKDGRFHYDNDHPFSNFMFLFETLNFNDFDPQAFPILADMNG